MSLDITIKERKEFHCPDCGRLVTTQDIDAGCSGGRVWYNFLEPIGYYVPDEKRTKENDWTGRTWYLPKNRRNSLHSLFLTVNLPITTILRYWLQGRCYMETKW